AGDENRALRGGSVRPGGGTRPAQGRRPPPRRAFDRTGPDCSRSFLSRLRLCTQTAMPPPAIIKPSAVDFTRVVADAAAIRAVNPQRFEMEALTAIVMMDP